MRGDEGSAAADVDTARANRHHRSEIGSHLAESGSRDGKTTDKASSLAATTATPPDQAADRADPRGWHRHDFRRHVQVQVPAGQGTPYRGISRWMDGCGRPWMRVPDDADWPRRGCMDGGGRSWTRRRGRSFHRPPATRAVVFRTGSRSIATTSRSGPGSVVARHGAVCDLTRNTSAARRSGARAALGRWSAGCLPRRPRLGERVKSGHLWTPQIRPFPASRDGSLRFTSWRPVLARLSESPAFAASAATPDRARRAHAPIARRASGVKTSTAGTSPSRPGRKAHNCSLSGGTAGVSPGRAEAQAEDARSALTRRSARSYLRPYLAASHRTRPSAAAANPPQFRAVLSSSPRPCLPYRSGFRPTHTCLRRAGCLDPGAPASRSALEHVCVM